jgi:hypothetical protein
MFWVGLPCFSKVGSPSGNHGILVEHHPCHHLSGHNFFEPRVCQASVSLKTDINWMPEIELFLSIVLKINKK